MAHLLLEKLNVFLKAERLADETWAVVRQWNNLARDTVGKQLIRAADSVGANIAEGYGRGSYQDNRRFVRIARGSLLETRFWLRRAHQRDLLTNDVTSSLKTLISDLGPSLNAYLRSIGQQKKRPMTNDQ